MKIEIIRSDKRVKTVTAQLKGDVLQVLAPAHLTDAQLQPIIERLQSRLEKRVQRNALNDADLEQIAQQLNRAHFGNRLTWNSIVWSARQNKRYGSCTPALRSIRISTQLAEMPRFVLEYVVMHELAHLLEANHSAKFWKLVNRYPLTERARGYLMARDLDDTEQAPDDFRGEE
ncbi:MAG: M48 family metallopeptidase [Anaerolineales bacterium]